jgi:hypothetical protein
MPVLLYGNLANTVNLPMGGEHCITMPSSGRALRQEHIRSMGEAVYSGSLSAAPGVTDLVNKYTILDISTKKKKFDTEIL